MPIGPVDKWEHIGDGVYVCHDGYQIWLGANGPYRQVALEPGVLSNLDQWRARNFSFGPPKDD